VRDLAREGAILHEQHFQLLDVVDDELLEAIGADVTGLGGRAIADLGHQVEALEASAHSIVDTLGLAPVLLEFVIAIALMTHELLGALLHEFMLNQRPDCHFRI